MYAESALFYPTENWVFFFHFPQTNHGHVFPGYSAVPDQAQRDGDPTHEAILWLSHQSTQDLQSKNTQQSELMLSKDMTENTDNAGVHTEALKTNFSIRSPGRFRFGDLVTLFGDSDVVYSWFVRRVASISCVCEDVSSFEKIMLSSLQFSLLSRSKCSKAPTSVSSMCFLVCLSVTGGSISWTGAPPWNEE